MEKHCIWSGILQNPLSLMRLTVLYPITSAPDVRVCTRMCLRVNLVIVHRANTRSTREGVPVPECEKTDAIWNSSQ